MEADATPRITFFTRRGCHLCDAALFDLRHALARRACEAERAAEAPARAAAELHIVDIDVDRRRRAEYDLHVPVIHVNDEEVCRHRLDRSRLAAALEAAGHGVK